MLQPPDTRGILVLVLVLVLVLGLDAPEAELAASFEVAARHPQVKGFAVGRTIFGAVARCCRADHGTGLSAIFRRTQINHTCFGSNGRF